MDQNDEVIDTEDTLEDEEEYVVSNAVFKKADIYDKFKSYANKDKTIYNLGSKEEFDFETGTFKTIPITKNTASIEKKLDTKDRKKMSKTEFGIPELKKYPLNDASHVKSAISYFSKAPAKYKHSLALKIMKAAKKYGVEVSKTSDVYKEANKKSNKSSEGIVLDYSIESYINNTIINK